MSLTEDKNQIDIPAQFKPANVDCPAVSEDFSACVGQVHQDAEILHKTLLNRSMDANDGVIGSGYRAINQSESKNVQLSEQNKKDREALSKAARNTQKILDQQLADIDRRLGEIEDMRAGIKRQIAAIENGEGVELDEYGSLKDKDAEKSLQEYEKRTGKKVDRNDPEAVHKALLLQDEEFKRQHKQLTQHKTDINNAKLETRAEIEKINNDTSKTPEQKEVAINLAVEKIVKDVQERNNASQKLLELQKNKVINDDETIEKTVSYKDSHLSIDDEIKTFTKELKAAQDLPEMDRLAREKELVDDLSEEAAEFVSFEETTEYLFEGKYFEPLSTTETIETKISQASSFSAPGTSV